MSTPTIAQALSGPQIQAPEFDLPSYKPLDLSKSTVVITGGSSGIGLALAKRFIKHGSTVLVVGRRTEQLEEAKISVNSDKFHIFQCNVGSEEDRVKLFQHCEKNFPNLNILVNNAGIQRRVPECKDNETWVVRREEIAVNFEAPIHLIHLFTPLLLKHNHGSAIINVSSGTAFTSAAFGPVYAATKAGLHNYTVALRYSLAKSVCQVYELIPPAVHTNLGGGHAIGEDLDEFSDNVFDRMLIKGEPEVGFKFSEVARKATRGE